MPLPDMSVHNPAKPKSRPERSTPPVGLGPSRSGLRPQAFQVLPEEQPWWNQIVDQFQGDAGAGYAISLLIHVFLLILLAIPVIKAYDAESGFTTLVENADNDQVIFDAPLDTVMAMPDESSSKESFQSPIFDPTSTYLPLNPELKIDSQTMVQGEGNGAGNAGEFGGGRIAEPENAVRAGNFSVWPWPILPGKVNDQLRHGTPGESPRVNQSYSIVIRIKVPREKSFVRLSDFTGSVVGTDGYTQKIPDDAYFFRGNGDLARARSDTRMPVIDGTAEILIRVPGASFAEVKDTIRVYSRILNEEQEINLVFRSRN